VKTRTHHHQRRAFTIIEVMFVLIIIGIIGGIVAFNYAGIVTKSKAQATRTSMKQIQSALKMYFGAYGSYPAGIGSQALQALVDENFLDPGLTDAWQHPFDYYSPASNGAEYELISYGPDGPDGSPDNDIIVYPDH
jgi:general secretion pathway protein G